MPKLSHAVASPVRGGWERAAGEQASQTALCIETRTCSYLTWRRALPLVNTQYASKPRLLFWRSTNVSFAVSVLQMCLCWRQGDTSVLSGPSLSVLLLSLCHTEVWPLLIIHLLHYVIFNRAGDKVEAQQQQQQQKGQDAPTAVCWSRVQRGQTSCSSLLCWHKIRSLKWGRAKQQARQFSSSDTQTPPDIHVLCKLHLFIYSFRFMVVYSMRLPLYHFINLIK